MKLAKSFLSAPTLFLSANLSMLSLCVLSGCVIGFTNAEVGLESTFRRLYVPSATDSSVRGGQAARVSGAVRRALSRDTRFTLTSLDEARWAIDIRLADRRQVTTKISDSPCVKQDDGTHTGVVASRSYNCGANALPRLKDPKDPSLGETGTLDNNSRASLVENVPSLSSEKETIHLSFFVRIIDLETGQVFSSFKTNLPAEFDVVGSDEIQGRLAATPEIHALRYVDNMDTAVEGIGSQVATQILAAVSSLESEKSRR
jgi:hypothetical protein